MLNSLDLICRYRLVATFGAVLLLSLLTGCEQPSVSISSTVRPVSWMTVEASDAGAFRTVPAVIQSKKRASLAFQVPGRVSSVAVNIGDTVVSGQLLASLDDDTFRLSLEQRRAELAQASAALVEAESEYSRDAELIVDGAISETEFERSRARLDTTSANVDLLRAAVGLAQETLNYAELLAPYSGEITRRLVEPAQQVQVGQTVLEIQGGGVLEAVLTVSEDWINRLEMGSEHRLTIRSLDDLTVMARVSEIGRDARINNAYPVTLELSDAPNTVRSGMSAEVRLSGFGPDTSKNAAVIPLTAFLSGTGDETFVFVISEDDSTVEKRGVETGSIVPGGVEIVSGLSAGDRIVDKGVTYLRDGQPVRLLGDGPQVFLQ